MATRTVFAKVKQRASKEPRKKRTRPEPRQYTVTDLERAQDRVSAAERRVDADRTDGAHSRAGLECKNWYPISRTVSDNGASRQHG
jgi:hypothetical protein